MTKNIIVLGALFVCFCSSAFAQDRLQITESINKRFARDYPGASNVEWTKTSNASVAQFSYQNNFWIAYYKDDGEKLASGRKIAELDQLPLNVQQGILEARVNQEKRFGALQASYAIEMIKERVTRYHLPMENSRVYLVISVANSGDAVIAKKHLKHSASSANAELLAKTE